MTAQVRRPIGLRGWALPRPDVATAVSRAVVRERGLKPRSDVLRQGDVPTVAHLLLEGHTYRYRLLDDGRRQITAVLMPGDICDLEAVMRGRAGYGVSALTDVVLGEIPAERIVGPAHRDPDLEQELWGQLLQSESISREWMVNLGRRTALEKVAHLLCELRVRLDRLSPTPDSRFDMHFTQSELADAVGISTVHINRVLQNLRRTGLIEISGRTLAILDVPVLEALANFDSAYLQMM